MKEETGTIRINKEVIRRIKVYSAEINLPMKDFVEKALSRMIKRKVVKK